MDEELKEQKLENQEIQDIKEVEKVEEVKEVVAEPQANNFEEVKVYQEVRTAPKQTRTDSYFDGGLLELIGWRILAFLVIGITFGIATPWAQCMLYNYQYKHTVYNGKRLKFEGTGGDLFVNYFKWFFFTIITLGFYAFVIPVKKTKWVVSNLHYEDEEFVTGESFFDGNTLQLIGINLLSYLLCLVSLGLLFPFTVCFKLRWINKHTVINRKKLVFDGKALNLFGKYILWCFLTIITFGIYGWWLEIKMLKWQTKNIHIKTVGEVEQKDNAIWIAIPIAIGALILVSFIFTALAGAVKNSNIKITDYLEEGIKNTGIIKENKPKAKGDYYEKQMVMENNSYNY